MLVIRVPFRRRPRRSDKVPHMSQDHHTRQEPQLTDSLLPQTIWAVPGALAPLPVKQGMEVCKPRREPRPHLELGFLLRMTRGRGLGHDADRNRVGPESRVVCVVDGGGGRGHVDDHGVGVVSRLGEDDAVVDVTGDGTTRGEQGPCKAWYSVRTGTFVHFTARRRGECGSSARSRRGWWTAQFQWASEAWFSSHSRRAVTSSWRSGHRSCLSSAKLSSWRAYW